MTDPKPTREVVSGVPFFPGLSKLGEVQIVACKDGEQIMGPFGNAMTVRIGKAVRRGNYVFKESKHVG